MIAPVCGPEMTLSFGMPTSLDTSSKTFPVGFKGEPKTHESQKKKGCPHGATLFLLKCPVVGASEILEIRAVELIPACALYAFLLR
jgi:hypothetical protein